MFDPRTAPIRPAISDKHSAIARYCVGKSSAVEALRTVSASPTAKTSTYKIFETMEFVTNINKKAQVDDVKRIDVIIINFPTRLMIKDEMSQPAV